MKGGKIMSNKKEDIEYTEFIENDYENLYNCWN